MPEPHDGVAFRTVEPEVTVVIPVGTHTPLSGTVGTCSRCGGPCFWMATPPHCLHWSYPCDICHGEAVGESVLLHCDTCDCNCCPPCAGPSFALPAAAAAAESAVTSAPVRFRCPITREVLHLPLMDRAGHNFEGRAIKEWLVHSPLCPVDAELLSLNDLFYNRALQEEIEEWHAGEVGPSTVPQRFICPITHDVMQEPLMDQEGHNFDGPAIRAWLLHHDACPIGRELLRPEWLYRNVALGEGIAEWEEAHPSMDTPKARRFSGGLSGLGRRGSWNAMNCVHCNGLCDWITSLPYESPNFRCDVCGLWRPVRQSLLRCSTCQWNCCLACHHFRSVEGPRGSFCPDGMVVAASDPNKRTDVQCAHCRAPCVWMVPAATAAASAPATFHCGLCDRRCSASPGVYYCDHCSWACCSPCTAPWECSRCHSQGWRIPVLPHVGECRRCFNTCADMGRFYCRCECGWQVCSMCAEGSQRSHACLTLAHSPPAAPQLGPLWRDGEARYALFLLVVGAFIPFLWCMSWPLLRSRRLGVRVIGAACLLCWVAELVVFVLLIVAYAKR
eukprot:GGOE01053880.1.p1 GENE.GGOE01053880.1~~GGOE01053880.1.p1  ORF type:complete len:576 (-),score=80.34 GGOE01053880.1:536-2212(-)